MTFLKDSNYGIVNVVIFREMPQTFRDGVPHLPFSQAGLKEL